MPSHEGGTALAVAGPLDQIPEGLTPEGLPFEDEQHEAGEQTSAYHRR